jgi:hypothetical protein
MGFCRQIIDIIEVLVWALVEVVTYIIETVCRWVRNVITVIVESVRRICRWLGPFSVFCRWVAELIEEVRVVWEWICEDIIIDIIVEFVERTIIYIFYVSRWVCWVICIPLRAFDILLCYLGLQSRRSFDVCVKILTDNVGTPAKTTAEVRAILTRADELLDQCGVDVCIRSISFVQKEEYLGGVNCDIGQLGSSAYTWFERQSCLGSPKPCTLFFVKTIDPSKSGCTIPGTSYILLADSAIGATVAHELGHHAELGHRSDPNNIMFDGGPTTKDKFTKWQCCLIRSCEFVFSTHNCDSSEPLLRKIRKTHEKYNRIRAGRPLPSDVNGCGCN